MEVSVSIRHYCGSTVAQLRRMGYVQLGAIWSYYTKLYYINVDCDQVQLNPDRGFFQITEVLKR